MRQLCRRQEVFHSRHQHRTSAQLRHTAISGCRLLSPGLNFLPIEIESPAEINPSRNFSLRSHSQGPGAACILNRWSPIILQPRCPDRPADTRDVPGSSPRPISRLLRTPNSRTASMRAFFCCKYSKFAQRSAWALGCSGRSLTRNRWRALRLT